MKNKKIIKKTYSTSMYALYLKKKFARSPWDTVFINNFKLVYSIVMI